MDKTPTKKGRPKKIGFKGTPNKNKSKNIPSSNILEPNYQNVISSTPRGLQNKGENVCFFNSVMQMLYSLPTFRTQVLNLESFDEAVNAIKNLFGGISSSDKFIKNIVIFRAN